MTVEDAKRCNVSPVTQWSYAKLERLIDLKQAKRFLLQPI